MEMEDIYLNLMTKLDFIRKFKKFINDNDKLQKKKTQCFKKSKNYTCFRHFQNLQKILISSY